VEVEIAAWLDADGEPSQRVDRRSAAVGRAARPSRRKEQQARHLASSALKESATSQ
jgi:hypothetical protein